MLFSQDIFSEEFCTQIYCKSPGSGYFLIKTFTGENIPGEKRKKKITPEVSYVEVITILPFLSICLLILCCVNGYPLISTAGLTVLCSRKET